MQPLSSHVLPFLQASLIRMCWQIREQVDDQGTTRYWRVLFTIVIFFVSQPRDNQGNACTQLPHGPHIVLREAKDFESGILFQGLQNQYTGDSTFSKYYSETMLFKNIVELEDMSRSGRAKHCRNFHMIRSGSAKLYIEIVELDNI